MQVLLIDNYDSFTFNLAQLVKKCKHNLAIKQNDAIDIEEINRFDKIIFSPGPGTPSDFPILSKILNRFEKEKSILGVCLGHQAIAEHYGAKLVNLEQPKHGSKERIDIILQNEYIFTGLPKQFEVGLYHSWAIFQVNIPAILEVTSVGSKNIVMSLRHKNYDIVGLQFHPESYMTDNGERILSNWLEH